ncbi:hypothetical protein OQA88_7092 [Cercophora sp. LCS_1]
MNTTTITTPSLSPMTLLSTLLTSSPYLLLLLLLLPLYLTLRPKETNTVPPMPDFIPYITNTYLFMTNLSLFYKRAEAFLAKTKANIISYQLGPQKVYLVNAPRYTQALSRCHPAVSSDYFMLQAYKNVWGATPSDMAKFTNDKSGRAKQPLPGTEDTKDRYWLGMHNTIHDHLAATHKTNFLGELYQKFFIKRLEGRFPKVGKVKEVGVHEIVVEDMAWAATATLGGTRILEKHPEVVRMTFDFDAVISRLVWGLPKWMDRGAQRTRDALLQICQDHYCGLDLHAGEGEGDKDWDEAFGSSFAKEFVRWGKEDGQLTDRMIGGGVMSMVMLGTNGNTTPAAEWSMLELMQDRVLLAEVRKEIATAWRGRDFDVQKLLALPLLQSVYFEIMRLHMSMPVTRLLLDTLNLGGHVLEKGAILQASTDICHHDEELWGVPGHPASEFRPQRHIEYVETTDADGKVSLTPTFSVAGKQHSWFPYGGGLSMCPGRFFAKQEIMLTIAILAHNFDMEFVEWTNEDGTPSDRPARNNLHWVGAIGMPPDRRMKVRWKRVR